MNWISVTMPNGKYTLDPICAEIAARADNAAISTPTDKYAAQLKGFDNPYQEVT